MVFRVKLLLLAVGVDQQMYHEFCMRVHQPQPAPDPDLIVVCLRRMSLDPYAQNLHVLFFIKMEFVAAFLSFFFFFFFKIFVGNQPANRLRF